MIRFVPTADPSRPAPKTVPIAVILFVEELWDLAERVAYHFENQQSPIGDTARELVAKVARFGSGSISISGPEC